jgi:hypothetical protein
VHDKNPVGVDYLVTETYPSSKSPKKIGGSSTPSNYPFTWDGFSAYTQFGCGSFSFTAVAQATDTCGNVGTSAPQTFNAYVYQCYYGLRGGSSSQGIRLAWASDLEVPGARGQVVLNGQSASFPRLGRSMGLGSAVNGVNRVEAQLAEASGQPGTWRFEFGSTGLVPGSLRVIAGDVAQITDTAVTFRLNGTPGERVVFAFDVKR